MADAQTQNLRILKIKTGVCKRLYKETIGYQKEAKDQKAKIEKFKEEGKDEYFLKQQHNNLKETEMVLPDVRRRFRTAHAELTTLTENEKEALGESEEYKTALSVLEESRPSL